MSFIRNRTVIGMSWPCIDSKGNLLAFFPKHWHLYTPIREKQMEAPENNMIFNPEEK